MSAVGLETTYDTGGISVPNFFNGRILSAEDLRLLMEGDRSHRRLLGQAIGPGVAVGLRVSSAGGSRLAVTSGLAINGYGETAHLPQDIELDVSSSAVSISVSSGIFVECIPGSDDFDGVQNAFVLTVRPDSVIEGSAPSDVIVSGAACGPGFVKEGVRFRRVAFDPQQLADELGYSPHDPFTALGQNIIANMLLGSSEWQGQLSEPLRDPDTATFAQDLIGLEPCEVPLAAYVANGATIINIDEWAVRRHCAAPPKEQLTETGATEEVLSQVRSSAGAAGQFQFQAHLGDLIETGVAPKVTAHMPWIPAAGVLPAALLGNATTAFSFAAQGAINFFDGLAHRLLRRVIAIGEVEPILRRSIEMPSADNLNDDGPSYLVGLISPASGVPRSAIYFRDDHPFHDRIVLEDLVKKVETLDDTEPADPETPRSVVVRYQPYFTGGIGKGSLLNQAAAKAAAAGGEAGLLAFLAAGTADFMGTTVARAIESSRRGLGETVEILDANSKASEAAALAADSLKAPIGGGGPLKLGSEPTLAFGVEGQVRFSINPNKPGVHDITVKVRTIGPGLRPFLARVDSPTLESREELGAGRTDFELVLIVPQPIRSDSRHAVEITFVATSTVDSSVTDHETIVVEMTR